MSDDAEGHFVEVEDACEDPFVKLTADLQKAALICQEVVDLAEVAKAREQTSNEAISMRDWFAGQALMGHIVKGGSNKDDTVAEQAYRYADAMIRARGKE